MIAQLFGEHSPQVERLSEGASERDVQSRACAAEPPCDIICGVETISPRRTVSSADASLVLLDLFSVEICCTDSTASAIFIFIVGPLKCVLFGLPTRLVWEFANESRACAAEPPCDIICIVKGKLDARAERAAADPLPGESMRSCPSSRSACLFNVYSPLSLIFLHPTTSIFSCEGYSSTTTVAFLPISRLLRLLAPRYRLFDLGRGGGWLV